MTELAEKILNKSLNKQISAAAELIRKIEEESSDVYEDLQLLYEHTGNAYILGITGLPGSGKSTIINLLIKYFRKLGKSIGVVAVDPSSPYSNGAILGDRIRMIEHSKDPNVFIKSIATRGWYGGLSRSAARIINVMDAMGKDVILLETVGVGQTEVSVMNFAHTTVLVLVPEMGDYVQTIKAGVLEIGDIFVINKIDKRDPGELLYNMKTLLDHQNNNTEKEEWKQQIILTDATANSGFDKLLTSINMHGQYFLKHKKELYLKNRAEQELRDEVYSHFVDLFRDKFERSDNFESIINDICSKKADPYSVSVKIIEWIKKVDGSNKE